MRALAGGLLATCLAFALWAGIVAATGVPRFILPGPGLVLETWWENRALLLEHSFVTATEVALGLAIGVPLGFLTAVSLASSEVVRLTVRPLLVFTQALPVFALAPILTLWIGFGIGSKAAMAVLFIYFPITSAFFDALMRTPPGFVDLARTMGASERAVLWRIRVPNAMPGLVSGLRLAAVYAPIGAVIGEWVGASRGLGYLMLLANGRAKTDLMFAAMFTLGIFSIALYLLVTWATAAYLRRHTPGA